jgi:hypothetical protein
MTKKKSRKRRPATYRAPAPLAEGPPAQRPGMLASLFAPRVSGTTGMPRLHTSFGRGFVTVMASPTLVVGAVVFPFLVWLILIAVGFQGPATVLANVMALPPIGTFTFDVPLSSSLFGTASGPVGLIVLAGFLALRSVLIGVVFGLVVEMLQTGKATLSGVVRGLWSSPVVFAVTFMSFGLYILGQVVGTIAGASLAFFVFIAVFIGSIYLFVFAPLSALTQGTGIGESIKISVRAARMPGAGNLGMASVYGIVAIAIAVAPGVGATIGLDPTPKSWVYISLISVFHVAVSATFAYRWLCIEDEVPDAPAPKAAAPARKRR